MKNSDIEDEPFPEDTIKKINKEFYDAKTHLEKFIKKVISCEDLFYSFTIIVEVYILMKLTSILNDKFIICLALNVIILYAPLEKNFPHFLFKSRMAFKQIIDGVIGILDAVIPKYEEIKK